LEADEVVNAKKARLQKQEALDMAREAHDLYATKGKKVFHLDLKKDPPEDEEITRLMLGPTGNLRAPVLRQGKTLIVGFDEGTYQKLLG
jgi:arsenate reductase-like glutaredoxin family protein